MKAEHPSLSCKTCVRFDPEKHRRAADDPLGWCEFGFRTYETETCPSHTPVEVEQ